jgi:hypothetical protein
MLIQPVSSNYFFEVAAPREYFRQAAPLSRNEADAAGRDVVQSLLEGMRNTECRPEAVISGLIDAAFEQAVTLFESQGFTHATQHADGLITGMIYQVTRRRAEREPGYPDYE